MARTRVKAYVVCSHCGLVDSGKSGTSASMICPDCGDARSGKATMCRSCCPTEHGCTWEEDFTDPGVIDWDDISEVK
jgi:predicted RNA-binding Zn-ribbon protein involved in translation (DUF1610 family)